MPLVMPSSYTLWPDRHAQPSQPPTWKGYEDHETRGIARPNARTQPQTQSPDATPLDRTKHSGAAGPLRLPQKTVAPGARMTLLPQPAVLSSLSDFDRAQLIGWLQCTMSVLHEAGGSADFLPRAAQAGQEDSGGPAPTTPGQERRAGDPGSVEAVSKRTNFDRRARGRRQKFD